MIGNKHKPVLLQCIRFSLHPGFCFRKTSRLLLALLLLLPLFTFSQKVQATAKFSKDLIRIGDQTELTLQVNYNEKDGIHAVKFPVLKDTVIGKVEILSKSEVEKYQPDKNNPSVIEQTQKFIITCFDSGYYAIPPFRFMVNNDSNTMAESEAIMLTVKTVAADTSKAPKDIKPPLDEPYTFRDALPYIVFGLAAIAVIVAIIVLVQRNNKRPKRVIPKEPPLPAHLLALRQLDALRDKKLWQEGKLKEYHSELSDIIRAYIEHTFPVNALELTTDEILYRFRRINIPREIKNKLQQLLVLSDMVKFAKETPVAEENELSLMNAYDFVRSTMPAENTGEKEENDNGTA
ncbi:MAG TPA: hypothetical protein VI112_16390 [Bacteroidia bacterium]|jgi:hypothetical protein